VPSRTTNRSSIDFDKACITDGEILSIDLPPNLALRTCATASGSQRDPVATLRSVLVPPDSQELLSRNLARHGKVGTPPRLRGIPDGC
jgi:hypothetical protein